MNYTMVVAAKYKLLMEDGSYNTTSHANRKLQFKKVVAQGEVDRINAQSENCGLMYIVDEDATKEYYEAGKILAKENEEKKAQEGQLKEVILDLVKPSNGKSKKSKKKKKEESNDDSE